MHDPKSNRNGKETASDDTFRLSVPQLSLPKGGGAIRGTGEKFAVNPVTGTGSCVVNIPEELFDLDGPGHYFRRIKSVSVTIPCVTGPYAGVTCTLAFGSMMVFPATSVLTQGTHY